MSACVADPLRDVSQRPCFDMSDAAVSANAHHHYTDSLLLELLVMGGEYSRAMEGSQPTQGAAAGLPATRERRGHTLGHPSNKGL